MVRLVPEHDGLDDSTTETGGRALPNDARDVERRVPTLTVLAGPAMGLVVRLDATVTVIGRMRGADLRIDDPGISRRHTRLAVHAPGSVTVEDMGSRNGTWVDGERVTTARALAHGNRLQLGESTVLRFGYQDDLEAAFYARMYESAVVDALTQVYNRRFFEDRLRAEMAFASRHGTPVALLLLDCDRFKAINDTYGHVAGDMVLREFARTVRALLRTEDLFARVGGDEFAVLLRGIAPPGASRLGERIRVAVERAGFYHGDVRIPVTASIGVGAARLEEVAAMEPEELYGRADDRLYEAKRRGRNVVVGASEPVPSGDFGSATVDLPVTPDEPKRR